MKSGAIYFEIQADDPNRAVKFYTSVFGWAFQEVQGLPVAYWRIETGGARGGLLKRPAEGTCPAVWHERLCLLIRSGGL